MCKRIILITEIFLIICVTIHSGKKIQVLDYIFDTQEEIEERFSQTPVGWRFENGEPSSVYLVSELDGEYSLAGWNQWPDFNESIKLFENDCEGRSGYNGSMSYSSLRLEKMGILELTVERNVFGVVNRVEAEVDREKINRYADLEYLWSEQKIEFCSKERKVDVEIAVPEIAVKDSEELSENINQTFQDGVRMKLETYGLHMEEMENWENVSLKISCKMTFESAEYISFYYTGNLMLEGRHYVLNFGTTCHVAGGGDMIPLEHIRNQKVFGIYDNFEGTYLSDNVAFEKFLEAGQHYTDYYLMPQWIDCFSEIENEPEKYEDVTCNSYRIDTVELLRRPFAWGTDSMQIVNDKRQEIVFFRVPAIFACEELDRKMQLNRELQERISQKVMEYGIDTAHLESLENQKIGLVYHTMEKGETAVKFQFELTMEQLDQEWERKVCFDMDFCM